MCFQVIFQYGWNFFPVIFQLQGQAVTQNDKARIISDNSSEPSKAHMH